MSFNQPRSDKTEQHYRKTGRSTSFNQQRTTSGAYGKGAGGVPAPSPSLSSNRSFKKSNNVQGGQSSVTSPAVNSSNSPSVRNVQNGPHVHPPLHVNASPAAKPVESATTQRSTRAVSKAPTSQPATVSSDSTFPMTPSKASGDASKAFSVQFGSISPGFMNRMRVPARTSSVPPNLDEQKPAQARHDSSIRYVPNMPTPVPKQQQPWKDSVPTVQSNSGEAHPVPKVKKDAHASVASPTKQTQKPSHPTQMAFHHHQQVSMQFGGPNPQFQSPASIQLPIHMPLPMGNAPQVQQQVLVPGLQAHTLPPQGMMHQDQSLNFSPPIGAQLPPHLGNVGMDITPQYPQQQGGKFGVPRKASPVKVTHPGSFSPGRDLRLDLGYGAAAGFRPAQGGNFGVLRHPRGQAPLAYIGGILGGPKQPMGLQGGMPRNSPDSDRWQRATNYQHRGLVPSPQTPLQMMHKAERKYIVGIVAGEEESKQRQLKAILDKLTPQNFEKLFEQVKALNIDNAVTLTGVILQIFDKAVMESTFCEMYVNLCYYLAGELPDFSEDNEKITFKRLLLNKCQEEFERGEREQEEANKVEEEGEAKQSEEEREEKRIKARRRMLGNIRLIGELYKKKMLTERIMHECIKKLLGEYENPDEEDVEALCILMSTIGDMIDHLKAKVHMDAYFERMTKLSNNMKLSSRVRFMLKDAIDLRMNNWQQRRKVEGPKKIEEVHRDAAQE